MKRMLIAGLCGLLLNGALAATDIFQATLVSLEPETGSIVLQRQGGAEVHAVMHKSPRLWIKRKTTSLQEFAKQKGLSVMVRMSIGTSIKPTVRELADLESWTWLGKSRKGILKGVIAQKDDKYMTLEFADKTQFSYKINARTKWERDDKAVKADQFKKGDTVFIVPRLLSNLDTALLTVSSNDKSTAGAKANALPALEGVLKAVDTESKTLSLQTEDMVEPVSLRYDDKTEFLMEGKTVAVSEIKTPVPVTISRREADSGNVFALKVIVVKETEE